MFLKVCLNIVHPALRPYEFVFYFTRCDMRVVLMDHHWAGSAIGGKVSDADTLPQSVGDIEMPQAVERIGHPIVIFL